MKIIVANQKGGAGKTTHAILLSNYLSIIKKENIIAIDMDFQSTFHSIWQEDKKTFDNSSPYEVIDIELEESNGLIEKIKDVDGHVVIDLPGKIDDNNLIPIIQAADLIVTPFSYDRKSFTATHLFSQVVRHLNADVPIVFIPNRLKAGVNYLTKQQSNSALEEFGEIAPIFSDRIAYQRIDTVSINQEVEEQITKSYNFIYDKYLNQ